MLGASLPLLTALFIFYQFIHLFKTQFLVIYSKEGSCKGYMYIHPSNKIRTQTVAFYQQKHFLMFYDLVFIHKSLNGVIWDVR